MSTLTDGKHWWELPEPLTQSDSNVKNTLLIHVNDFSPARASEQDVPPL